MSVFRLSRDRGDRRALLRRILGGGAPAPSPAPSPTAPLASVNDNGAFANWSSEAALNASYPYSNGLTEFDPDNNPLWVSVADSGFDGTGQAITQTARQVVVTKRRRQAYTNGTANTHLLAWGAQVALSETIPQGSAVIGADGAVANNSTKISPRPVSHWMERDRQVIGDSHMLRWQAYHWSGVACTKVWFRENGGSNRKTAALYVLGSAWVKSTQGGRDRHTVVEFQATVNTAQWEDGSAVADGTQLIAEAEVYPRIGLAASIRKTADIATGGRGFSPRLYLKNTARRTNPVYANVATTGTDAVVLASGATSGGVQKVSTDPAVARANPFLTRKGALEALKAATTLTGGFTDGCIVQMRAGTYAAEATTAAGTYQTVGEVVIETDPIDAAWSAVVPCDTINFRQSWVTYRNVTISRTSSGTMSVLTGGRMAFVDIKLNTNQASWFVNTAATGGVFIDGLEVVGGFVCALASGTTPLLLARGVDAGTNNSGTTANIEAVCLTGCSLRNYTFFWANVAHQSNSICSFFSNMGCTGNRIDIAVSPLGAVAGDTVDGVALVTYVVELSSTSESQGCALRIAGDDGLCNLIHLIDWYGSSGGTGYMGRSNSGYSDTTETVREHAFWSEVGFIRSTYAHKESWFQGTAGGDEAGASAHVLVHPVTYGVGAVGCLYRNAFPNGTKPAGNVTGLGGSEQRAYYGRRSASSSATNGAGLDPLFAGGDGKASTVNSSNALAVGTGGVPSDYAVNDNSPAIGLLDFDRLPFDLAGNPRNRRTAGAFR